MSVEVLAAESEIRLQLHKYCRAVNELDAELLISLWHADGTIDCEEPALRGAAADLTGELIDWHRSWPERFHQLTNWIIKVDGDSAVSETYTLDVLRPAPGRKGDELDSHRRGRYLDRWSKRDGRWALDHRQFVRNYEWRQQVFAGSVEVRAQAPHQETAVAR